MIVPTPLGRLERVGQRAAWTHEAIDFTPKLAAQANTALLGDAIGLVGPRGQEDRFRPFGRAASVMRRRSRLPVQYLRLTNEDSIARLELVDGRRRSQWNASCDRLDG